MIVEQIKTGSYEVFCYILGCEETRQAAVIDPGGDEGKIIARAAELGLTIRYIINTHGHPDHTCGNRAVQEATGALIISHEADVALLAAPEGAAYFGAMGFSPAPRPDRLVGDNEIIQLGKIEIRVIHTPGHSPGSICLLALGNLFTGDALFVGAAGRVDLPGGDFNTQVSALEEKIASLPGDTVIWPGHDYGDTITSTIGREKRENPYLGGEW